MGTGYTDALDSGFQFVVDEGKAKVWKVALTSVGGELSGETTLSVEELSQGAKIRVDPVNGRIFSLSLNSFHNVSLIKAYGDDRGVSQVFDMLVDAGGNYLMGGHHCGRRGG